MSYVTIQDWMIDLGLPLRETVLIAIIYGFSQDGESKCYATQEYLCRWLQCTPPTLNKAIAGLIDKGLIIKEQPNPHGKCVYRCKETLYQCKETLHRQYKETLHNNKSIDISNNRDIYGDFTPNKPDYEAEFTEIWALYPKKEGRQRALTAYTAARRKGVSADVIRQGVERYARQVEDEATPPQYIKQGGNWFAAHRWEDQHILPRQHQPKNRALNFMRNDHQYTDDYLQKTGITLGQEFYEELLSEQRLE